MKISIKYDLKALDQGERFVVISVCYSLQIAHPVLREVISV